MPITCYSLPFPLTSNCRSYAKFCVAVSSHCSSHFSRELQLKYAWFLSCFSFSNSIVTGYFETHFVKHLLHSKCLIARSLELSKYCTVLYPARLLCLYANYIALFQASLIRFKGMNRCWGLNI